MTTLTKEELELLKSQKEYFVQKIKINRRTKIILLVYILMLPLFFIFPEFFVDRMNLITVYFMFVGFTLGQVVISHKEEKKLIQWIETRVGVS